MDRRQLLFATVLSITSYVCAENGQHTVVAMVVGKGNQTFPEIKVNGVQMPMPKPQAMKEASASPVGPATYVVGKKVSDGKPPAMAAAIVTPSALKPKTVHDKIMDDLKLTKEEKEKLFPCEDYKPYCKNYYVTGQCRDVWTQKNCRKSCKLCDVPYGVFIGCQDMDVCKKFASTACMVSWVRETCKSKCSACGYERQSNSNIVMGKKRHFPATKTKNAKKASKVLKKIATKGKDQLKKAVKVQKIKEEAPKKTDQVNSNDKLQVVDLKPKKATDEKAVPKDEEDVREESGEASKVMLEKGDENDGGDDAGNNDSEESGSTESVEDEDDDAKASGNDSPVHSSHSIKIDADPMGEPVVAKMVH
ncbi:uncharacterized protein LOC141883785 [Acropora palmata]|uniref:uncharacterized protein LOC141883785 n=1 Tax=Acropora palmata TaxID=6131 RepID=UPI003DA1B681